MHVWINELNSEEELKTKQRAVCVQRVFEKGYPFSLNFWKTLRNTVIYLYAGTINKTQAYCGESQTIEIAVYYKTLVTLVVTWISVASDDDKFCNVVWKNNKERERI